MIEKLQIKNFQSHKDSTLEFSPGVNVIVGSSDSGKSAIIRGLRWLAYGKPRGDSMRSWWGGDITITVQLSDCEITRKKGSTNTYFLNKGQNTTEFNAIGHEVPQEIGDFAVLVYGGFSKKKALAFNFLSALTAILGALVGYSLSGIESFQFFLLPFAAGGFIYIAMSDLIPELHKEKDRKKSFVAFVFFLVGIILMWGMKIFLGG